MLCCFALAVAIPTAFGAEPALVPWPSAVQFGEGKTQFDASTRIVAINEVLSPLAQILSDEVFQVTGRRWPPAQGEARDGDVVLALAAGNKPEQYTLSVGLRGVRVEGSDYAAVAMGTATLLQALEATGANLSLPRMTVRDRPGFAYRAAMLDVARKPHSIATLKQCVQVCRYYKIRHLQLHLTDENAWTFPSTLLPKLGSQNFAWAGGDKPIVYPLAALNDLVGYADARGVTLVPEIEMPGHSGQLRGTYPELFGYRDAAGKDATPGVINMVRDETLQALDKLIGEVAAVFKSSPYIHLGGDEASITEAQDMPEVKAFIAKHQLSGIGDVFNLFVNRLHRIAKKNGKRMIAWEGIPLAPAAPPRDLILMPWVGGSPFAAEAVRDGYAVINAPWGVRTPYMDPFQVNGAKLKRGEPLLHGAVAVSWQSPEDAAVPFLRWVASLRNEPVHNPESGRDHADFLRRLHTVDPKLDLLLNGFTLEGSGKLDPRVFMRVEPLFADAVTLTARMPVKSGTIRYTTDGSEPKAASAALTDSLSLRRTTTVKARRFAEDGRPLGPTFVREFQHAPALPHSGVGARVTIAPEQPGYAGAGAKGLTDGYLAAGDEAGSPGWVGWEGRGTKIDIMLDLGREVEVKRVAAHFLRAAGGIFLPKQVELAASADGKSFQPLKVIDQRAGLTGQGWFMAEVTSVRARHLRVTPTSDGDWTFIDEVTVNAAPSPAVLHHAARGKPATMRHPAHEGYNAGGLVALTDGYAARSPDFMNLPWLGVEGKDFDATIDLGQPIELRAVGANFLQYLQAGIRIPTKVQVLASDDGKSFRNVATVTHKQDETLKAIKTLSARIAGVRARYVRLVAPTNGLWLFADEIFVNPDQ